MAQEAPRPPVMANAIKNFNCFWNLSLMGKAGTLRSLIVAETTQPHVVQSAQLRTNLLSFEKVHTASVSFSVLIELKFDLCLLTLSIN